MADVSRITSVDRFLNMSRRPIGNRQQLFHARLALSTLYLGEAFTKGFGDGAGHALARGAGNCLCELMCFGIFDVKAHG